MKTFIISFILSLSCSGLYQHRASSHYIEIRHTGMETKPIKILVISTKEVNKNDFTKDLDSSEIENSDQRNTILDLLYTFLVTDNTTYQLIIDFCNDNHNFFTNSNNKNHGDYRDYSIEIEGKNYNIFYEMKDQFFEKLMDYIIAKNGDDAVIEQLSHYLKY